MKKIVFFGSKKIGLECLQVLFLAQEKLKFEIVGVLTNERGKDIIGFCKKNSLSIIKNLNHLLKFDLFDIGISVQYHEILKKQHINRAKEVMINLHMAPLPEYRGCNQFSFAIMNGANIFGTTIHKIDSGIDSGDILFEDRFPISNKIWVEDLFNLTFRKSIKLFKNSIEKIIYGNYVGIPQEYFLKKRSSEIHYRKEINELKIIDLDWDEEKIKRHIRATYMPGFELPYTLINDQKIYFNRKGL